jgi:hypothetical protein
MDIWYILRTFEIFYGHLVHLEVIWYIFHHFGKLNQEKSGNPASGKENEIKQYLKAYLGT